MRECEKIVSAVLGSKHESEMSSLLIELDKLNSKFDQYMLHMNSFPEGPYTSLEDELILIGNNLKFYRKSFKKLSRSCFFKRFALLFSSGNQDEKDSLKNENPEEDSLKKKEKLEGN